jgi:hypothetical protein
MQGLAFEQVGFVPEADTKKGPPRIEVLAFTPVNVQAGMSVRTERQQ